MIRVAPRFFLLTGASFIHPNDPNPEPIRRSSMEYVRKVSQLKINLLLKDINYVKSVRKFQIQ